MIPRPAWGAIKARLSRTPTLAVRSADRAALRRVRAFLSKHFPGANKHMEFVPISTMQWSSVVITHRGERVGFIDIEQANALELLMIRDIWAERPIIAEVDFLIRAAEALFDDGDIPLAASMTERANQRLREYCAHEGSGSVIARPKYYDKRPLNIVRSRVMLAFIAGHECGHLVQLSGTTEAFPFMEWVAEQFEELRKAPFSESINSDEVLPQRERFIFPEIVQKFNDEGIPNGFASFGTKMAATFRASADRVRSEVQADAVGVLAATDAAINGAVEPDVLFSILFKAFEYSELLLMLRRLIPRLPRGGGQAAIAHEGTNHCARLVHYLRLIHAIRDGEIAVPETIADYWKSLPDDHLVTFDELEKEGKIEQIGERGSVVARGGIEVGLYGKLADFVPGEERRAQLGLMAGALIMGEAHRSGKTEYYLAEAQYDWSPEKEYEPLLSGFGCAFRDIAELSASEKRARSTFSRAEILRDGNVSAFIEFLRSGRSQIVRTKLDAGWADGFENLLR